MNINIGNEKSKIFATLLDILSCIVDEVNIEFRKNEIYIQTMDSGRISLFELILKDDWFETYDVEKSTVVGVKLSIINKILNCRHPSQSIHFEYTEDNDDKLDISLVDGGKGTFNKYYQTSVYDFDNELLNLPEVDADAEFTINSITIFKLFEQLKQFGENININCNEKEIKVKTVEGEDFTGMTVVIPEDDIVEYSVVENESINVEYAISPICKAFSMARLSKDPNISDDFGIYISNDSPIMIEFKLIGDSVIKFWVAPKISLDD